MISDGQEDKIFCIERYQAFTEINLLRIKCATMWADIWTRDQWRALVSTVDNLSFPLTVGNSLNCLSNYLLLKRV